MSYTKKILLHDIKMHKKLHLLEKYTHTHTHNDARYSISISILVYSIYVH